MTYRTPVYTARDVLVSARSLIEDESRWTKGAFERRAPDGEICYCAVGALRMVDAPGPEFRRAIDALRDAVGGGAIYDFNDHPGTTHTHVLAAFDSAIAIAERAAC